MPETDINKTTQTELDSSNLEYSTPFENIDEAQDKEFYWLNDYWSEGLGILKNNPAYKERIRALARWAVGKGFKTDNKTLVRLRNILGWGEDSFQSVITNLIITKKTNGDAYAEVIRNDKGELINLKPLNPKNVRIVVNHKGMIKRYDVLERGEWKNRKREEIFHLCNDRIASEIHGTPAWKACKWELEAKQEVMQDWRRISHRSTIRVMYIDAEDTKKLNQVKSEYKDAIKNGEVMLIPAKKGDAEFIDYNLPPIDAFIRWIEYLDRAISQSLGIPNAIADTTDYSEASSKVGYMTFEPVYTEEQTLLEQDLFNQLAIKIKFNRPPSLSGTLQDDEEKNTGQTTIQQNELKAGTSRSE